MVHPRSFTVSYDILPAWVRDGLFDEKLFGNKPRNHLLGDIVVHIDGVKQIAPRTSPLCTCARIGAAQLASREYQINAIVARPLCFFQGHIAYAFIL